MLSGYYQNYDEEEWRHLPILQRPDPMFSILALLMKFLKKAMKELLMFLAFSTVYVAVLVLINFDKLKLAGTPPNTTSPNTTSPTSLDHIVFGISSSARTWPERKDYLGLWWNPLEMRGCAFVEETPSMFTASSGSGSASGSGDDVLPPLCVSPSATGGTRNFTVVLETIHMKYSKNDVRWFVFGDDDTVFFSDHLLKTLSKHDHDFSMYVGSINLKILQQNAGRFFDMAFGGGGFAISYPLARKLDYCYTETSDEGFFFCVTELGVGQVNDRIGYKLQAESAALLT